MIDTEQHRSINTKSRTIPVPTDPGELKALLKKSAIIQMRLTELDKEDIKNAASEFGLTVTEYLLRCHWVISKRLGKDR